MSAAATARPTKLLTASLSSVPLFTRTSTMALLLVGGVWSSSASSSSSSTVNTGTDDDADIGFLPQFFAGCRATILLSLWLSGIAVAAVVEAESVIRRCSAPLSCGGVCDGRGCVVGRTEMLFRLMYCCWYWLWASPLKGGGGGGSLLLELVPTTTSEVMIKSSEVTIRSGAGGATSTALEVEGADDAWNQKLTSEGKRLVLFLVSAQLYERPPPSSCPFHSVGLSHFNYWPNQLVKAVLGTGASL